MTNVAVHAQHYDETRFWKKLAASAMRAGQSVVEKALCLYYSATSPETPAWARGVMLGALGYFIMPIDAVPDLIPGAGFVDDLGALTAALAVVAAHVTVAHKERARQALANWIGSATCIAGSPEPIP